MKRIEEVFAEVRAAGLAKSDRQLTRYLAQAFIRPVGARSCPQLWPDDTAKRILASRGWGLGERVATATIAKVVSRFASQVPGIVSMAEIKAVKRKARR